MNNSSLSLQDLFLDGLADIYYAENQLVRALPKMAKAANNEDLKKGFQSHLKETEGHVKKVEKIFGIFGEKAKAKKCHAIVGLLAEADEMASENKGETTLDAALIAAAQKVEHYEIGTYGTLHEWAILLENESAADLLQTILDEERAANDALTDLAKSGCNAAATEWAEDDHSDRLRSNKSNRGRCVRMST
ncbi:MAG: ferritin-like domain-containing protein [Verrucomicrobia bacterium]|nr:ferritin-like domain-containing protein [Verrucomicrobiota bacterium]